MGFCILQASRCRMHLLASIQSTSLGSFRSEDFFPLRSTLCSGFKSKLVESHNVESSQGVLNQRWNLRAITTQAEQRTRYTGSSKLNNIGHEFLDATPTATMSSETTLNLKMIPSCDTAQKIEKGSHLKHRVKVFVFDLETTGFRKRGRIVEIAFRDLTGGKNSCFHTLINPEQNIPNSHIHGITTDMVNHPNVPRMKDLIPILVKYIRSREIPGGVSLFVAHNGRCFDVPFLMKEFSRCSEEIPDNWLFIDTIPLARELMKLNGLKLSSRVSLQALREHYQIPEEDSNHRAMSDVNILSEVLERLTFDLKLTVTDLMERSFKASDYSKKDHKK